MSNRSLIEINHDYEPELRSRQFVAALASYVRSGSIKDAAELERFGVRVFGMRHHSDGFSIKWGQASPISEPQQATGTCTITTNANSPTHGPEN